MTEAEAFELALMASANGVTSFSVYITVTFGYLAAAYVAGTKLTTYQMIMVSCIYVISAMSAMLNLLSDIEFYEAALRAAPTFAPQYGINAPELWRTYMSILLTIGIFGSLYFMHTMRSGADGNEESREGTNG